MDQSDLDLLQIVPSYHVQTIIKSRHVPLVSSVFSDPAYLEQKLSSSYPLAVLEELARYLFDVDALHEVLRNLDEGPALILRELVLCGGRANSRDLALYFTLSGLLESLQKAGAATDLEGQSSTVSSPCPTGKLSPQPPQPPQYPPSRSHGTFELALRHLLVLGLVFWGRQMNFVGRDYTSGEHDGVVIVATSVRAVAQAATSSEMRLDKATDRAFSSLISEEVENGHDLLERPRALQRALYLYWSFVATQREGFSLLGNGLLSRSALRLIVETMVDQQKPMSGNVVPFQAHLDQIRTETDVPYLYFLRLMLMQLGLLVTHNSVLKASSASTFFSLSLQERVRRCYQLYRDQPFWNELAFLSEINVRPGPAPLEPAHREVLLARQAVLEHLQLEAPKDWFDIAACIAHIKLYIPYLLFPRQYGAWAERYSSGSNPYNWDFRLKRGWLNHRDGWHMVEGGFIRAVLGGPLYWLGLVELDRSEYPLQFRFSAAAFFLFDEHTPTIPSVDDEQKRIIVQPNFDIIVLAPVSEAVLVLLDCFAERVQLDLVACYRVSRASITRAVQRGLHVEEIIQQLETMAGSDLPQNVRYSMTEWERQARRIELWQNITLLEVDDEALIDELLADEQHRTFFGRRLSPRLIEVCTDHLATVQELFWQRNILPALTVGVRGQTGQGLSVRELQWQLHENGLLQPLYPVLDLYQVAGAQRFCEVDPATSWLRITAQSVSQAKMQGMTLDQMIDFLRAACLNGIPSSFLIRLKIWGDGYSDNSAIAIESAPLLRLPEEVFQDLQSDAEISALLGSEVAPSYRLVRVDHVHLERLLAVLRERGFQV
jgi:hypothetical protein